jgi:hypothetical protein
LIPPAAPAAQAAPAAPANQVGDVVVVPPPPGLELAPTRPFAAEDCKVMLDVIKQIGSRLAQETLCSYTVARGCESSRRRLVHRITRPSALSSWQGNLRPCLHLSQ